MEILILMAMLAVILWVLLGFILATGLIYTRTVWTSVGLSRTDAIKLVALGPLAWLLFAGWFMLLRKKS